MTAHHAQRVRGLRGRRPQAYDTAGRKQKGVKLRHLYHGLPVDGAVHAFSPGGQLVDVQLPGLARSVAIWGDDLLGYMEGDPKRRWWFDVETEAADGKAPVV